MKYTAIKLSKMLRRYSVRLWHYCLEGVWNETKSNWWIDLLKTMNLSVRSFLDKNLQQKSGALTYSTFLAIVPVLAMIFAIGRGFGFQNLIQSELFKYFPAQSEALKSALTFVDSYLAQSSEGIFVGIGIVFLLWSLYSLLSNVEEAFNHIWGVRKNRSFYRKLTDYTAIFLILPILMVCANGISLYVTTASADTFLSPMVEVSLDIAPIVLAWLFFTGVFKLIPYTKVNFKNAFVSGVLCGSGFMVLQWLFVSGQIYVSKYNAIYGSFAFLPLLLIWLQLSWLICLSGVVLTYSSQNIFRFNFSDNINEISIKYHDEVTLLILAIIVKRFCLSQGAYTKSDISEKYDIPIKLVSDVVERLDEVGLISSIVGRGDGVIAYQPAFDVGKMTIGAVSRTLRQAGKSNFIPALDKRFGKALSIIEDKLELAGDVDELIKNLPITLK